MNAIQNLLAFFLVLILTLSGNGASGDKVERFANAAPQNTGNIAIPGYETLSFKADRAVQTVYLINPPENACTFVLRLTLEDGETLWTGKAISPGEAFTRIALFKALPAGSYAATLHYDCYTIEDNQPLNGAEIQLTIEVR